MTNTASGSWLHRVQPAEISSSSLRVAYPSARAWRPMSDSRIRSAHMRPHHVRRSGQEWLHASDT
ncbi:hypothetical protein BJF83_18345 [Nocardiopsis sp. CNR-923]|nr:hypothetical protein BJF83_18345 [Nocardiopsis sp. CNR-923]